MLEIFIKLSHAEQWKQHGKKRNKSFHIFILPLLASAKVKDFDKRRAKLPKEHSTFKKTPLKINTLSPCKTKRPFVKLLRRFNFMNRRFGFVKRRFGFMLCKSLIFR